MLWLIVLIAPLGLLVYLFRSRRPSRAVLAVLLCGFFASVVLVAMVAGAVAGVLIGEAIAPAPSQ